MHATKMRLRPHGENVRNDKQKECWVSLSDEYKRYLSRCLGDNPDPYANSVSDLIFNRLRDTEFKVVEIGDGIEYDKILIELPKKEGETEPRRTYIKTHQVIIIRGSFRGVPKRGKFIRGRSSMMGRVSHGIRSGRAFRGR